MLTISYRSSTPPDIPGSKYTVESVLPIALIKVIYIYTLNVEVVVGCFPVHENGINRCSLTLLLLLIMRINFSEFSDDWFHR